MKNEQPYPSISDLVDLLAEKTKLLEAGSLDTLALQELTEASRELYERLVVIRFNAFRDMSAEASAEPEAKAEAGEPQEINPGEFRIGLSVDDKQTSLIDAIEEIEQEIEPEAEDRPEPNPAPEKAPVKEKEETPEVPPQPVGATEVNPIEAALMEAQEAEEEELVVAPIKSAVSLSSTEIERPEKEASVNEKLSDESESLADQLGKSPLDQIRGNISLNEKFLLINQVFSGNTDVYESTLAQLDEAGDLQAAMQIVEDIDPPMESKGTALLRELVQRRYSEA